MNSQLSRKSGPEYSAWSSNGGPASAPIDRWAEEATLVSGLESPQEGIPRNQACMQAAMGKNAYQIGSTCRWRRCTGPGGRRTRRAAACSTAPAQLPPAARAAGAARSRRQPPAGSCSGTCAAASQRAPSGLRWSFPSPAAHRSPEVIKPQWLTAQRQQPLESMRVSRYDDVHRTTR